jgi:hypothetical protein
MFKSYEFYSKKLILLTVFFILILFSNANGKDAKNIKTNFKSKNKFLTKIFNEHEKLKNLRINLSEINSEINSVSKLRDLGGGGDSAPALVCSSECAACQSQASSCTSCSNGYYYIAGSSSPHPCYRSLSGYFVVNGSILYKCDNSCRECVSNHTNCYSCNSGFYKYNYNTFPTYCYSSTTSNHFLLNGELHKCGLSCLECVTTADNCNTCNNGFFKELQINFPTKCYEIKAPPLGTCFNMKFSAFSTCDVSCLKDCKSEDCNKCLGSCKEGYFPVLGTVFPTDCYNKLSNHILLNNFWEKCDSSCAECVEEKTKCTICAEKHYRKFGTSFPTNCYSDAITSQPFYFSEDTYKECNNNCKTCVGTNINCTSCHDLNYQKVGIHNPNICYPQIQDYFLETDKFFHPCDISCNNCITNKFKCNACKNEYFEKINNTFPTECNKHPYNGWFLKENKWNSCDISCSTCVGESKKCLICANNYYPKINQSYPTECFTAPLDGWYLTSNTWDKCDYTVCETCINTSTTCTKCSHNYFNRINEQFPVQCYPCGNSCKTCVNYDYNCRECSVNFYRRNIDSFPTNCHSSITGWYLNEELLKICDQSCYTCVTSNINCIVCATNYKFKEDKKNCFLFDKAPIGYYFNKSDDLHRFCDVSCYTCSTKFECTKCADNYFPLEDVFHRCINKSLVSYTNPDTNIAYYYNEALKNYSKCAVNCKICAQKPDHCVLCNYEENYFHLEDLKNTCLNVCPDFYFRNFLKRECTKCHISCKNCIDTSPSCLVN